MLRAVIVGLGSMALIAAIVVGIREADRIEALIFGEEEEPVQYATAADLAALQVETDAKGQRLDRLTGALQALREENQKLRQALNGIQQRLAAFERDENDEVERVQSAQNRTIDRLEDRLGRLEMQIAAIADRPAPSSPPSVDASPAPSAEPSPAPSVQDRLASLSASMDRVTHRAAVYRSLGLHLTQTRHPERGQAVRVTRVAPGTPAHRKNLQSGDLILEVSQQAVTEPAEVAARIAADMRAAEQNSLLLVLREGETGCVALPLGE